MTFRFLNPMHGAPSCLTVTGDDCDDDCVRLAAATHPRADFLFVRSVGRGVTDKGVADALRTLQNVRSLLIEKAPAVTGNLLGHISLLPELVSLELVECGVEDEHLRDFKLPAVIRSLTIKDPGITDDGLSFLNRCSQIDATLSICRTQATDATFQIVATTLPAWSLSARGTSITDAGLLALAQGRPRGALDLGETGITDVGTATLDRMQEIEDLHLYRTRISNESMQVIGRLSRLVRLDVSGTQVSDIMPVQHCRDLQWLDIENTSVMPESIAEFNRVRPDVMVCE